MPAKRLHNRLSLRTNFIWTLAGNLVNALSLWGVVVILTKTGSASKVGQFELARSIVMPIIVFSMMHLRTLLITDVHAQYEYSEYLGTRIFTTVIGYGIIVLICLLYYRDTYQIILFWGVAKAVESVSDINRGFFQRHERMQYSGISMMLRGLATVSIIYLFSAYFNCLALSLSMVALAWAVIVLFYEFPRVYRLQRQFRSVGGNATSIMPSFDIKVIVSLFRLGLPLALILFFTGLETSAVRTVLERQHGEAMLGYLGAIAYPLAIGTMVVNALGQSCAPRLAIYFRDNHKAYFKLLAHLLITSALLGLVCVILAASAGPWLLTMLYRSDYAQYQPEFVLLAVGLTLVMMASFCGFALTAARCFSIQVILRGISCLTAIICAVLFIPAWGIRGAAYSILITALVLCVSYMAAIFMIMRKRSDQSRYCL